MEEEESDTGRQDKKTREVVDDARTSASEALRRLVFYWSVELINNALINKFYLRNE
jgi:hypothetical protein